MKTMTILFTLLLSLSAHADQTQTKTISSIEDDLVSTALVDGYKKIPSAADLSGSVVTVYRGSAYALSSYFVTVINNAAPPMEGDDSFTYRTFEVSGMIGSAKETYSRQVDKNTYSIAIIGTRIAGISEDGTPIYKKTKALLRVKFNATGIEEDATLTFVDKN